MIYKEFEEAKLSRLGMGCMRFPTLEDGKTIDQEKTNEIIKYAYENGINYFDTAYSYHYEKSEEALCEALKDISRENYYLADKFPGHEIWKKMDPKEIFETQLKRLNTDYFDFYLLHNVTEFSYEAYTNEDWGIVDYLVNEKKKGRIKHLGFSQHAQMDTLKKFVDKYGKYMDFCQMQLNYLDWDLLKANETYDYLVGKGFKIWVMEPARGGKLATVSSENEKLMKAKRPDDSIASWAFRWVLQHEEVQIVLSGMSTLDQVKDNLKTFNNYEPISDEENEILAQVRKSMMNIIPCTGCGYCLKHCAKGINIPLMMRFAGDIRTMGWNGQIGMTLDSIDEDKRPESCIKCGACMKVCPQSIKIPEILKEIVDAGVGQIKWADERTHN